MVEAIRKDSEVIALRKGVESLQLSYLSCMQGSELTEMAGHFACSGSRASTPSSPVT